nr:MAG TPA: hypothetical protein [Caudoviricetes sp.]
MDKVRDKIKSITKEHGFRKCICYLLAFLIVFSLIWLFCSQ